MTETAGCLHTVVVWEGEAPAEPGRRSHGCPILRPLRRVGDGKNPWVIMRSIHSSPLLREYGVSAQTR